MTATSQEANLAPLPLRQELDFWLGIMTDHSRSMRNAFDPTEEKLFRRAHDFGERFALLRNQNRIQPELSVRFLIAVQELLAHLIVFKGRVAAGLEACQILAILPAGFIEHIRREAIFFSGVLARLRGGPRPTLEDLGLPGSGMAVTAPQVLIPRLRQEFRAIAYEEMLFWLRIDFEHMGVLAVRFLPEQEAYRRETLRWGQRLAQQYDAVLSAFNRNADPRPLFAPTLALVEEHAAFLTQLFNDIVTCSIPGGQTNFWPRLVNHMWREGTYFIQVLRVLISLADSGL